MFEFGSGTVWFTPISGNEAANPTPIQVGTLQDVSLDIQFDLKMLYGHNQFPESVARGKGKITGKAKFGRFNSDMISQVLFGGGATRIAGSRAVQLDELADLAGGNITAAIPHSGSAGTGFVTGDEVEVTGGGGSGAVLKVTAVAGAITALAVVLGGTGYTTTSAATILVLSGVGTGATTDITAAAATATYQVVNHATAVLDLGVRQQLTGVPLLKVGSSPAVNQYSVDGTYTYTFNAADETNKVVSYMNLAAGAGVTQQATNQLMGTEPICTVVFRTIFNNQEAIILLYSAVIGKMTMASKLDDYTIPEIDFEAFANAAGQVLDIYAAE